MRVVGVLALFALLAASEGLSVTKTGSLKKHDKKKDVLPSSIADKKDSITLTGQTLVPKKEDVKDTEVQSVAVDDTVLEPVAEVSNDDEVSLKVRQQIRDSEGVEEVEGVEVAAAKQDTDGGVDLAADPDLESKLLQIGNAQIGLGSGTGVTGLGGVGTTSVGLLGSLFNLGNFNPTNLFTNFPSIQVGAGGTAGGLVTSLTQVGLGSTLFGGAIGIGAALAAGLAGILAFVVPGLQIANQILAIIAISMLGAYLAEDKEGDDYYETGYDSGTGYDDSGSGYSLSGSGYGSGPGVLGSGTGYSSYSDYRRSALAQPAFDGYTNIFGQQQVMAGNTIDGSAADSFYAAAPVMAPAGKPVITGRSGKPMVSGGLVSRVGRMMSDAVEKLSNLYDQEHQD